MKKLILILTCLLPFTVNGQNLFDAEGNRIDGNQRDNSSHFSDTEEEEDKEEMPVGLKVWKVDDIFADRIKAEIDTMPYMFQNENFTEGIRGSYNHLGNMGSPRISRLYMERKRENDFLFLDPFDFFLLPPAEFCFTNTLSPITNVTYHECGDKTDGEDRISGLFAVNAGKKVGLGFKLDYLYGRGYYANQSSSEFNASVFGSYLSDKYELHLLAGSNHIKLRENGGITDDVYITNPESLPNSYQSTDIPTVLSRAWTRVYSQNLFLTQRYNIGYYRAKAVENKTAGGDSVSAGNIVKVDTSRTDTTGGSVAAKDTTAENIIKEFIPVASISHVLKVENNTHKYIDNDIVDGYYLYNYLDGDSVSDRTKLLKVSNYVSLLMREGFKKWVKAGISFFAHHDFMQYKLPVTLVSTKHYTENRMGLGGRIVSSNSKYFRLNAVGEAIQDGGKWGLFNINGTIDLTLPIKKDTILFSANAIVDNQRPSFYYRHYHGAHAWWDNDDLENIFRSRIEAELSYNRTRTSLRVGLENVKNYVCFNSLLTSNASKSNAAYSQGVSVTQDNGSTQVFEATLKQDFALSIVRFENEVTYSTSSNDNLIPLPKLSLYSNLYLLFKIARVLTVRAGADVKYFTEYYAPYYVPMIGQYAVQDQSNRVKVGNYPIIDVYANFHLKHTRFYIMASHINKSSNGGHYFLVPHYAYNPMTIKFGISWNFFN